MPKPDEAVPTGERSSGDQAVPEIDDLSGVDPRVGAVLEYMAALLAKRSERFTTEEACERLGVDISEVRARAKARETTTRGTLRGDAS